MTACGPGSGDAEETHRHDLPIGKSLTGPRYIVKFREGSAPSFSLSRAASSSGGVTGAPSALSGARDFLRQAAGADDAQVETLAPSTYVVGLGETGDAESVVDKIRWSGEVEYLEEDSVVHAIDTSFVPNDPKVRNQYAHEVVRSYEAWNVTQGSRDVVVAVIDTGVDYRHADLKANMWKNARETAGNGRDDDGNGLVDDVYGYDFHNNDGDPMSDDNPHFHGTHVAGTIGAVGDNGVGIAGHSLKVKIMAVKFMGADGSGYTSNAVRAIQYAAAMGAHVVSNSWGGPQASRALADAIAETRRKGALFVAAAGNGGQDGVGDNNDQVPTYPANYATQYDNVLTVAATDSRDNLTRFSNYGSRSVHVAAPGQDILSTMNGNKYQTMSGTSMATPLVSGVAALLKAVKPNLTGSEIRRYLMNTADQVPSLQGKVTSNGRVNAYRAVMAAFGGADPGPSPDPGPGPGPGPGEVARAPLIGGSPTLVVTNPYVAIPIDFDVSEFTSVGAVGAYVEISRPNMAFTNPNGDLPDPYHLGFAFHPVTSRMVIVPAQHLPGWGVYSIRVIPLDGNRNPVAHFSNASQLVLQPMGF